jgi:hypothetical protein
MANILFVLARIVSGIESRTVPGYLMRDLMTRKHNDDYILGQALWKVNTIPFYLVISFSANIDEGMENWAFHIIY